MTPPPPPPRLEIASFSPSSALLAARAGCSRIELCRSQVDGGLTPSLSTFTSLKSSLSQFNILIPVYVMIRPHARDFVYSEEEGKDMEGSIEEFMNLGVEGMEVDGFVFGVLRRDEVEGLVVDEDACKRLLRKAGEKPCTFHRAFDSLPPSSMESQLEVLIKLGFRNVLTSGGMLTAVEGKGVLKTLVEKASGRIDVIVGGGVRSGNVGELREVVGSRWYHSSACVGGGEVDEMGEGLANVEEVGKLRGALGMGVEG
ncbi:copper homeostasis protein cutC [Halenospora varia]|nr:copper homeostasis protein cutC [Halenospora varia]